MTDTTPGPGRELPAPEWSLGPQRAPWGGRDDQLAGGILKSSRA